MASFASNPQVTVPALSEERRNEILDELIDIALNAANAQIDGLTSRLADALMRTSSESGNARDAGLRATSATLLKQNRYPFFYLASGRLGRALRHEMRATRRVEFDHSEPADPAPQLTPELEVDKKICLLKLARKIEEEQADRLVALNARIAFLLGVDDIDTARNPFRPAVFLEVLHDSWCEFQPDTEAQHFVYRLMQPGLCFDMAPILYALNTVLIKLGVLAGIEEVALTPRARPVAEEQEAVAADSETDPIRRQLRKMFPAEKPKATVEQPPSVSGTGFPALFADTVLSHQASHHGLLDYLERFEQKPGIQLTPLSAQRQDETGPAQLEQIRREAPADTFTSADRHALDLVIGIFNVVYRERDLSQEMKTLIGGLQMPLLRAALKDKEFFFREDHPARRAIELLTRLAVGWDRKSGADDPLYQAVLRNVKRIQSDQRIGVYAHAIADIEAFMNKEERDVEAVLGAPIASAIKKERQRQAVKAAKHEVTLRIKDGEVVAFVETFLEDKWVTVLTLAYGVKDDKPQVYDSAVKTMDDLCWSVKPKITREERNALVAKLPNIVARLNKWLDAIKWQDEDRKRFFDELARCHAAIVRAPLELSPERQLQLALKVAKKAAERRQRRAESQLPPPEPDKFDAQVAGLQTGAWVEFRQKSGMSVKVRLAWVSPMRSYFVFATRERKEAFSLSDEELAQALRERRAAVLMPAGVVGRAISEALGAANEQAAQAA